MTEQGLIPVERIERAIFFLRGQKVMLDKDLARLYGVTTKALNQSVRRNIERFPEDFMFQLTASEAQILRSQFVTLRLQTTEIINDIDSRGGTTKLPHGQHRKFLPYAFTEQGVAMLSTVLRSPRAVQVNIEIMRAFVKLRQWLSTNVELAKKLEKLEKKYDAQFKVVFDAIRELMAPPKKPGRPIGFKLG